MANSKPIIIVTGPDSGGLVAWWFTALGVWLAGGKAVRMTPARYKSKPHCDGFIIGGGSDIHPDNRTRAPLPRVRRSLATRIKEALLFPMEAMVRFTKGSYDKARDEMEKDCIQYALNKQIPILGICRGHQLLNAVLGGTMYTSTLPLLGDKPRIRSPFPRKTVVYAKEDSLLEEIVGDEPIKVNAIHSQAVAKPGKQLQVSAREKAQIVQAIELCDNDKVLGVQWHPEYLFYLQTQRNIFAWLIEEARS